MKIEKKQNSIKKEREKKRISYLSIPCCFKNRGENNFSFKYSLLKNSQMAKLIKTRIKKIKKMIDNKKYRL